MGQSNDLQGLTHGEELDAIALHIVFEDCMGCEPHSVPVLLQAQS